MTSPVLFHPELESKSPAALRSHQEGLWRDQWDYIRSASSFYNAKLAGDCTRPFSLETLQDLPLTDKDELKESQAAHPPFGDYAACAPTRIVRLTRTSGTTNRAMNLAQSRADAEMTAPALASEQMPCTPDHSTRAAMRRAAASSGANSGASALSTKSNSLSIFPRYQSGRGPARGMSSNSMPQRRWCLRVNWM